MAGKIDPSVRRTTVYIALSVLVLSALMEAIWLITGLWDLTVLWGNLLGGALAVLNFFLMGLTIQHSLKLPSDDARKFTQVSQSLRMLMILAVCGVSSALPFTHLLAVLIPQFFPRIATAFWPMIEKRFKTQV